jgi:hypothetical protein
MFDNREDAASLIDGITAASRAENAALAHRLTQIGELDAIRERDLAECVMWKADPMEEVCAEIAAAQNISRGRATTHVQMARTLRDRLPQVAQVFATGVLDYRMISTIVHRVLTVDDEVIARIDAVLAQHAAKWMKLSEPKLRDRIDLWIAKYDPDGVRIPPRVDESRFIDVDATSPGMAGIWGNVHAEAAAVFDQRLDTLADTVCPNDSRTRAQRRADAVGMIGDGLGRLGCDCGAPDCAAAGLTAPPVQIHVLAEQSTIDGRSVTPGYLPGFGILPADCVRKLAAAGSATKPVRTPGADATPGYRPSAGLRDFLRWRDLTCRWPGCDRPARACDVEHTVPYPYGATDPWNTKLYCRTHHLIKTFYGTGWHERQLPDGTIVLTAPTGHVYTTEPHGAQMFPALRLPDGGPSAKAVLPDRPERGLAMPLRSQTREHDRQARIAAERRARHEINAGEERQRQAWLAEIWEPPPF